MFVKQLTDCKEIVAGDETRLREILNPHHENALQIDYSLAHAIVDPGQTTRPHLLKTSSEVYYILQGTGIMTIEDESQEVGPGDTIYIPPSARQFIKNTGNEDLVFLCFVSPPWHADDEVVFD
ncbi:MAG: cupin domain-containing protein [Candidatus Thorarchaeota archaeon]